MTPHRSWIALGLLLASCAIKDPYPPALPAPRISWENFEPLVAVTPPPPGLEAVIPSKPAVPSIVPLESDWDFFRPMKSICRGKGKRRKCTTEAASVVSQATQKATVKPKAQNLGGGNSVLLTYDYVPGELYEIYLTPTIGTSILLPQGEVLATQPILKTAPKEYDSEAELKDTWVVGYAAMSPNGQHQGAIVIRPAYAPQETLITLLFKSGLVLPLKLIAYPTPTKAMLTVSWRPPATPAGATVATTAAPASGPPEEKPPVIDRSRIWDRYTIQPVGKYQPPWLPVGVFDDGRRTYIRIKAEALDAGQAPVVYALTQQRQPALVQSRLWRGKQDAAIIVERLYPAFIMKDHAGLEVKIERQAVTTAHVQEEPHAR